MEVLACWNEQYEKKAPSLHGWPSSSEPHHQLPASHLHLGIRTKKATNAPVGCSPSSYQNRMLYLGDVSSLVRRKAGNVAEKSKKDEQCCCNFCVDKKNNPTLSARIILDDNDGKFISRFRKSSKNNNINSMCAPSTGLPHQRSPKNSPIKMSSPDQL